MGKDIQYFDKDLPDHEGQMKLLVLASEDLTASQKAAGGLRRAKKESAKGRGRGERPAGSSGEQLF
jgi:hypothetical protein